MMRKTEFLTQKQIEWLYETIKDGGPEVEIELKKLIINNYIPLVKQLVWIITGKFNNLLYVSGCEGLIEAVNIYEVSEGEARPFYTLYIVKEIFEGLKLALTNEKEQEEDLVQRFFYMLANLEEEDIKPFKEKMSDLVTYSYAVSKKTIVRGNQSLTLLTTHKNKVKTKQDDKKRY